MILTPRQKELYEFIVDYIDEHGYAPTLDEIGRCFGLSSLATVHKHLSNLQEKGLIRRLSNYSRAIELVPDPKQARAVELPLLGRVAAGQPLEVLEEDDATIAVPEEFLRGRNTYVLRVVGDSMVDDGIWDGDYIVVSEKPTPDNGDTVVALIEGNATVKRFYRERDGRIRLQPANPALKPMTMGSGDVRIKGSVVAVMRKY